MFVKKIFPYNILFCDYIVTTLKNFIYKIICYRLYLICVAFIFIEIKCFYYLIVFT